MRFKITIHNNFIPLVPVIISVEVTSNKPNPIRPIGSTVVLTCTVEVKKAIDIPVIVNIGWTGPELQYEPQHSRNVAESSDIINRYISTQQIMQFRVEQSGNYTCLATVTVTVMAINTTTSDSHLTDYNYEASKQISLTTGINCNSKILLLKFDIILLSAIIQF